MDVHETAQILTFWNEDVLKWNTRVRTVLFGPDAPYFHPGDRLVAAKTVGAITSSQEFVVARADLTTRRGVPCWKLTFVNEFYSLLVCDPTQEEARVLEETRLKVRFLKDQAQGRSTTMSGQDLQTFRNDFADLRHGYAQTIHKSQGSTYDQVFVESNKMYERMWKPDETKFRGKLIYVAYSRAAQRLAVL
jgi:hypothetical protein